jgi:hypothetical protein
VPRAEDRGKRNPFTIRYSFGQELDFHCRHREDNDSGASLIIFGEKVIREGTRLQFSSFMVHCSPIVLMNKGLRPQVNDIKNRGSKIENPTLDE